MFKKILILLILFALGFVFGLEANEMGFNSLSFKQNLDAEIESMKADIVTYGESFEDSNFFLQVFGAVIAFIGNWAEWLFLIYVIFIVVKMIIVYLS